MHSGYDFSLLIYLSHFVFNCCLYDITLFFPEFVQVTKDGSYDLNARYMFEYNTNDVIADALYYARLQAIKA
jgi:hypothetical protein